MKTIYTVNFKKIEGVTEQLCWDLLLASEGLAPIDEQIAVDPESLTSENDNDIWLHNLRCDKNYEVSKKLEEMELQAFRLQCMRLFSK